MSEIVSDNNFNVCADPATDTVKITLSKDGREVSAIEIDRNKASALAGTILGVAGKGFQPTGKPKPPERDVNITVVAAAGLNIGPGRSPETAVLIFYFGDTALGIEFPRSAIERLPELLRKGPRGGA